MTTKPSSFWIRDYLLVVIMWVVAEVLWYFFTGFHFDLEATKYITASKFLLANGKLSESRFLFYFSTIAIISFSFIIGIGEYGALAILMSINLLAYIYFFKALKFLLKDSLGPLFIIGLLLTFWPYQSWTLYLFTECLFYSAALLLFARLILFRLLDLHFIFTSTALLLLLIISRPLGILFVPPVLLFIFFKLSKRQRYFFLGIGIFALVILDYVVQVVFTTTSDWNMHRAVSEGDIICDVPGTTDGSNLKLTTHPNQLYQLLYYITHNFSHFSGLALTRLKYFFTMARPYYSPMHNLYLGLYLAVIYSVIVLGLKIILLTMDKALLWFIFSSVFLFALAVALQCDDWHNRFFLTLMPFLFTLFVVALKPVLTFFTSFASLRKR